MTPRQRQALLFIQQFIAEHGYGPSHQEIGDALHCKSRGQVQILLRALVERGYISFLPSRARAITVLRPIRAFYEVHVFNDVTKALEPYTPRQVEAAE